MCDAMPDSMTLYCICQGTPHILRFYYDPTEAQRSLKLIHDAFKEAGNECDYNLFTVTLSSSSSEQNNDV